MYGWVGIKLGREKSKAWKIGFGEVPCREQTEGLGCRQGRTSGADGTEVPWRQAEGRGTVGDRSEVHRRQTFICVNVVQFALISLQKLEGTFRYLNPLRLLKG